MAATDLKRVSNRVATGPQQTCNKTATRLQQTCNRTTARLQPGVSQLRHGMDADAHEVE
jgi:hypothetical protein